MTLYKSRVLSFLFFLCFCFTYGQDGISDKAFETEFEVLTGKTSYQLMNYLLKKSDLDASVINKEMQLLSDKIMESDNLATKAEWLYIKVRISFFKFDRDAYRTALEDYNLFVINNPGDYKYLAKQKLLEGYLHFYNGTWSKSLAAYEEALSLAKHENDTFTIVDSRKQMTYITTFSGDQEEALKGLKKVFYELDNNSEALFNIKKDIPLLKIRTLDLICRFYWFNRISKVDSLAKYSEFYEDKVKDVNDPLEYSKMYTYAAHTAVLQNKFDLAKQYVDSAKMKDKGFDKRSLISFVEAELYYNQKKYKEGIAVVEVFGNADSISKTRYSFSKYDFKFLAKSYKMLGNYERSNYYYEHFEKANTGFDKIMDSVSLSIRKREVEEFKKELEALQVEKESKDSILKYLVLAGSVAILSLLILLFRFYRLKNKNEEQFLELLRHVEKLEKDKKTINSNKNKGTEERKISNPVNEETTASILEGLERLEEQQYFLRQECSAYTMAKKLKTNTSYLSKVINSQYLKNFNTYINDLRMNYAVVKLKNDNRFRAYSIQSIAEELGYKSADSFTKYFKKHTGLLPSFYIKKLDSIE